EAAFLHEHFNLHAMVDLSDGLATDLTHITQASDVGAVVYLQGVPINRVVRKKYKDKMVQAKHALCDGEDFELCFSVKPSQAEDLLREQPLKPLLVSRIGEIVAGKDVHMVDFDGKK